MGISLSRPEDGIAKLSSITYNSVFTLLLENKEALQSLYHHLRLGLSNQRKIDKWLAKNSRLITYPSNTDTITTLSYDFSK